MKMGRTLPSFLLCMLVSTLSTQPAMTDAAEGQCAAGSIVLPGYDIAPQFNLNDPGLPTNSGVKGCDRTVSTLAECCENCEAIPECVAVSYNTADFRQTTDVTCSNACFYKSDTSLLPCSVGRRVGCPGEVTPCDSPTAQHCPADLTKVTVLMPRILNRTSIGGGCNSMVLKNYDIRGNDLQKAAICGKSQFDCCALCQNTTGCLAWTWAQQGITESCGSSSRCILKSDFNSDPTSETKRLQITPCSDTGVCDKGIMAGIVPDRAGRSKGLAIFLQPANKSTSSKTSPGLIIGASLGGVALALLAAALLLLCWCFRAKRGLWSALHPDGQFQRAHLETSSMYQASGYPGSSVGVTPVYHAHTLQGPTPKHLAVSHSRVTRVAPSTDTSVPKSGSYLELPGSSRSSGPGKVGPPRVAPAGLIPQEGAVRVVVDDSADSLEMQRVHGEAHNAAASAALAERNIAAISMSGTPGGGIRMHFGAMLSHTLGSIEWEIRSDQLEFCLRDDGSYYEIGSGSYGKVYKAILNSVTPVAVKVATSDGAPKREREFAREVAVLRASHDANVVALRGICMAPRLMLVMEFCERGDLWRLIGADRRGEYLWHNRGRSIALDVARGLVFLHSKGIVHFDLKSPNVVLDANHTAKIADVGLSKLLQQSDTRPTALGTFAWAAPEQLMGDPCSDRVDMWSFGVVLWEIVTGEHPPKNRIMRSIEVPRECPAEIAELIRACTNKDPQRRPSAKEAYLAIYNTPLVGTRQTA